MSYVGEVLFHRLVDWYLHSRDSEQPHYFGGVAVCASGGSEAGHCYARYPFAVESEDVESLYCHEQCERGVKSPDMPTVRCLHPVASRRCTSPAACMEDISSQRDARPSESEGTNGVWIMVRMRQSLTSGITVCAHRIVLYGCALFVFGKRLHISAVVHKPLKVCVGHGEKLSAREPLFGGQYASVLGDYGIARKHKVGR